MSRSGRGGGLLEDRWHAYRCPGDLIVRRCHHDYGNHYLRRPYHDVHFRSGARESG
ncbi:hypothetical protein ACIP5Y_11935 [Nocardia sp. NPDC088792]|uniref:hypothetical protein n=1 Tax=Nocardia sp. NPDC088792 TaxID=3364332 RepID=UPI0038123DDB